MAITRKRASASISDAVAVPPFHNTPRTLRSAEAVAARRSLLTSPHMAPLLRLTEVLRNDGRGTVPDFDPLDGGTGARILFFWKSRGR